MKQPLFIFALVFMTCVCSCRKQSPALPANSYKIAIDTTVNTARLIEKTYTIETSGLIYIAFEQPGGRNSSSIASNTTIEVAVTIKMEPYEDKLRLFMNVVIQMPSGTAKWKEQMFVPVNTKLSEIVTEKGSEGIRTDQMELIRASHGSQFIRLAVLRELPNQLP